MNPLSLLTGVWGYVAAAVVAALLATSATYYVTSRSYQVTISDMKAAEANAKATSVSASLTQLQTFIGSMHEAASAYAVQQQDMSAKFTALHKDFQNAIKASPLPLDCAPDPVRLRNLSAAVAAANAASTGAKPIPAVQGAQ